ncbi:PREDICTED: beta-1,3-glucan-binding protein-like, partial [Priapulus caudatus]|uniref:Beta-1,3-glucan-binding protein-like n=1 Tax=Priapulus caudatus TaxID=37621 RepID=A0ABM1EHN4_PRICU
SYVKDGVLFIKPTLTDDQYGDGFVYGGTLDLWGGNGKNDGCSDNHFFGCYREGPGFDPKTSAPFQGEIINPIQSARLRTLNSFAFKYGKVEVKAQMPVGDWLWPGIKLLPRNNAYGKWPASGEIDIVEARGNANVTTQLPGQSLGQGVVQATMHWGPYPLTNAFFRTIAGKHIGGGFHTYGVTWTSSAMNFTIDDVPLLSVVPPSDFFELGQYSQFIDIDNPWAAGDKMAPFDQEFYLSINLAVGGSNGFFSDGWTYGDNGKPWLNTAQFPMRDFWEGKDEWSPTWQGDDSALQVDSIRVYKLEDSE